MRYYEESKTERKNHQTALVLTISIFFLLFTGVIFAGQPELLPQFVKEWLNIENPANQENIMKEIPAQQNVKKKDKA